MSLDAIRKIEGLMQCFPPRLIRALDFLELIALM
jgi:hypothetical protein